MRRAFLFIAFQILNMFHRHLNVPSIRLHNLDRLSHRELVALFQKNVTWQVIPHTNTTSFSDLNCCCAEHETHETEEEKVENEFAMDAASEE